MRVVWACAVLACVAACASARDAVRWNHARTPHFEIYSDTDVEAVRTLGLSFERLHAFFAAQVGISPRPLREVRVICFANTQEYGQYRPRPGTGAFFIGAESRDYIVMPAVPRGDLRVAAHEYAHVLIHSGGWKLPDWISEGLGDVISTVQIREGGSRIGGDLPGRSQALKGVRWMTLPELFAFSLKSPGNAPAREGLFYAQSWALADLLMLSPKYSKGFPALLAALAKGETAERALDAVYGTPLDTIAGDLRARLEKNPAAMPLPASPGAPPEIRVDEVTPFAARAVLADLRLANGDLAEAESDFRSLAVDRPDSGEIHAALGTIALKRGDMGGAVAAWKRALEFGVTDADLCYRYAVLADERGLPARDSLQRALALRPDFDDARFKLALLEKNAGHAETAVRQLRAMRQVSPKRAFAWWSALSDALLDLGRREEARQSAAGAQAHAANGEEQARAAELAWLADTELAVEIEGKKFRTVRVPVGQPERNPFIEASDRAQRVEAAMQHVDCAESGLRLVVESPQGALTLNVPDPSRVQIRNAGSVAFEFVCGPQEARKVLVEYRPDGLVLRGLEFR